MITLAHQKIQNFHEIIEVIEFYSMNSGVPPTDRHDVASPQRSKRVVLAPLELF